MVNIFVLALMLRKRGTKNGNKRWLAKVNKKNHSKFQKAPLPGVRVLDKLLAAGIQIDGALQNSIQSGGGGWLFGLAAATCLLVIFSWNLRHCSQCVTVVENIFFVCIFWLPTRSTIFWLPCST